VLSAAVNFYRIVAHGASWTMAIRVQPSGNTLIEHTWYKQHKGRLGLKVTPFGGDNSEDLPTGVIISEVPNGEEARYFPSAVKAGMALVSINGQDYSSASFNETMAELRKGKAPAATLDRLDTVEYHDAFTPRRVPRCNRQLLELAGYRPLTLQFRGTKEHVRLERMVALFLEADKDHSGNLYQSR